MRWRVTLKTENLGIVGIKVDRLEGAITMLNEEKLVVQGQLVEVQGWLGWLRLQLHAVRSSSATSRISGIVGRCIWQGLSRAVQQWRKAFHVEWRARLQLDTRRMKAAQRIELLARSIRAPSDCIAMWHGKMCIEAYRPLCLALKSARTSVAHLLDRRLEMQQRVDECEAWVCEMQQRQQSADEREAQMYEEVQVVRLGAAAHLMKTATQRMHMQVVSILRGWHMQAIRSSMSELAQAASHISLSVSTYQASLEHSSQEQLVSLELESLHKWLARVTH